MTLSKNLNTLEYREYSLRVDRTSGHYLRAMSREKRSRTLHDNINLWSNHVDVFVRILDGKKRKGKRNVAISFVLPVNLMEPFVAKVKEEGTRRKKPVESWTLRQIMVTAATYTYLPDTDTVVRHTDSAAPTKPIKNLRLESVLSLFPTEVYTEEEITRRTLAAEAELKKQIKEVDEWFTEASLLLVTTRKKRTDELHVRHREVLDKIAFDKQASAATESVLSELRKRIIDAANSE